MNLKDIYLMVFQSTLPRGSDVKEDGTVSYFDISIHAPSRERPWEKERHIYI